MFSFLWGGVPSRLSPSRFLILTLGSGQPVLVNVDQVSAVYVRFDRHGEPAGCAIDLCGDLVGVRESIREISDALAGEGVSYAG